jgi:SAM-dependent methyltransferase
MTRQLALQCTKCGSPMGSFDSGDKSYECARCHHVYRKVDGILDCFGKEDGDAENGQARHGHISSFAKPVGDESEITLLTHRLQPLYVKVFGTSRFATAYYLDAGCGYGGLLAATASRFDFVVGVNTEWEELRECASLLAERKVGNAILLRASAENLPFADGQFAAASCVQVLEHVGNPAKAIAQLHRTLAPGGCVYLSIPNRYSLRVEPHTLLPWIGFLPSRAAGWYAARMRKTEEFHSVRFLSAGQLAGWLKPEFGPSFAFIRSGYHQSVPAKIAKWVWRIPLLARIAGQFVGDIEAIAWR